MPSLRQTLLLALAALAVAAAPGAQSGAAQEPPSGEAWNSERALELIRQGRAARHRARADSALSSYRATARGHVYFMIDRADAGERTLVKADQLALEVYWRAPDLVRQRIVGRRDERNLPTNITYHLDHLTVVTDDFGDRITLGEGDEVRSILHPLAPGSEAKYDVRLADSLTLRFSSRDESVRVYEIEVRPRDMSEPGFLGSVFLDRATGAVVRMSFTFTPASYVDPYLDHIRISLDNGRWLGRYWLPYRQQVEIRRELPQLDFPAGSVIQARWEIGDYDFDPDVSADFFTGPSVTRLPDDQLRAYDFDEGLYEPLDREGLLPPPSVEEVRRRALRATGQRYLSGLRRLRLFLPSVSSALRYNRAEGFFMGSGFSYRPTPDAALKLHGGYAFGRDRFSASARLTREREESRTALRGYAGDLRDLGPFPGTSGLANTFAAAWLEADYLDPWFASGASLSHRFGPGDGPSLEVELRWEEHGAARFVLGGASAVTSYRSVRPVLEGTNRTASVTGHLSSEEGGLSSRLRVTAGAFEERAYASIRGRARWSRRWLEERVELSADLHGGFVSSDAPPQTLFHLGGRETLPGYRYRSFVGDRFAFLETSVSWGVASPWLRPRAFGAVGWTDLADHAVPEGWTAGPTPIPHFSAGLGAGLLWDVLQVRAGRGLNGGEWEWVVSISKNFWPYL